MMMAVAISGWCAAPAQAEASSVRGSPSEPDDSQDDRDDDWLRV